MKRYQLITIGLATLALLTACARQVPAQPLDTRFDEYVEQTLRD